MEKTVSRKFQKSMVTIYPGEYYVSRDDEYINTLLGSCVAVCLFDSEERIAGMNHYMLEGKLINLINHTKSSDKHAFQSISRLISSMSSLGCKRRNLTAKIFGGGKVLETDTNIHTVPQDNIRAAKVILEMEDIPIIKEDLGGKFTRRVILDVLSGRCYVKRSLNSKRKVTLPAG